MIGRLFSIRAVLGCMGRLVRVAERVAVLEDGGNAAGSRAKDRRVGESKVGIQASLYD